MFYERLFSRYLYCRWTSNRSQSCISEKVCKNLLLLKLAHASCNVDKGDFLGPLSRSEICFFFLLLLFPFLFWLRDITKKTSTMHVCRQEFILRSDRNPNCSIPQIRTVHLVNRPFRVQLRDAPGPSSQPPRHMGDHQTSASGEQRHISSKKACHLEN